MNALKNRSLVVGKVARAAVFTGVLVAVLMGCGKEKPEIEVNKPVASEIKPPERIFFKEERADGMMVIGGCGAIAYVF